MKTEAQQIAWKKKMISAARAMLSMQVGLVVGAVRIDKLLAWQDDGLAKPKNVFAEFLAAIPLNIPLGNARLHWAPEPLLEADRRLAPIEAEYRERLLRECIAIIKLNHCEKS